MPALALGFCLSPCVWAQSTPPILADANPPEIQAAFAPPEGIFLPPAPAAPVEVPYEQPTSSQKFHYYAWNAFGPTAYLGASVAAGIDQAFRFPKAWGVGPAAYGERVSSNLGISLVAATSQYSLGEALHEDTTYYRCACTGFFRRFAHAAESSVTSRRGDDGHRVFSLALTVSPFVGPMVAANTWLPSRNGPRLGFNMGAHNLLGQFGQDQALEFLYGGPHTILGRLQHRFVKQSAKAD